MARTRLGELIAGFDIGRIPVSAWRTQRGRSESQLLRPPPGEMYVLDWPLSEGSGFVQRHLDERIGEPDGPPDEHGFLLTAQADVNPIRGLKRLPTRGRLASCWRQISPRYRTWITKFPPPGSADVDPDDIIWLVVEQTSARWVWRGCIGWLLRCVTAAGAATRALRPMVQARHERALAEAILRFGADRCEAQASDHNVYDSSTRPRTALSLRAAEQVLSSTGGTLVQWQMKLRALADVALRGLRRSAQEQRGMVWEAYLRLLAAKASALRQVHLDQADIDTHQDVAQVVLSDSDLARLEAIIRATSAPARVEAAVQHLHASRPPFRRPALEWYAGRAR